MFRQVLVEPEQRCLQRILWRTNPDERIETYELSTVTYGTTSASFLSVRCLFQLAQENREKRSDLATIIEEDFYVDDLLTGGESIEDTARMCRDITDILKQGCFDLRKFYSNEPSVLKYVSDNDIESKIVNFGENENAKTLGLVWYPNSDELTYKITNCQLSSNITKRVILSGISQVFDPLGLVSPCVILMKLLLQDLWLEKITWDEILPFHIISAWNEFRTQLPLLNEIRIKRHAIGRDIKNLELHVFGDSSEKAYGACAYIRSTNQQGNVCVHLLCSKTKVAPLKKICLPRLELLAALIAARLAVKIKKSLRLEFDSCIFWSDSMIVLGWVKMAPNRLKTFVANRITEIQEITASHTWRHVPSDSNPSDLLSRGVSPIILRNSDLWWHGPPWLSKNDSFWPNKLVSNNLTLPDLRKIKISSTFTTHIENNFIERFSDIGKLKRVIAYILRFLGNTRAKCKNETLEVGSLKLIELKAALKHILKMSQREYFSKELKRLEKDKPLNSDSKILGLNAFIDNDGLLRVGGRLANSEYSFNKKHPIILSSKSHITKLLMRDEHLRLLHAGPLLVLASIRETYWPIGGRSLSRKIVHSCIRCFRCNAKSPKPIMGNLPSQRLLPRMPFEVCGVDYAGPFLIKSRSGRGCKISKSYVCLFVCFVTKAVHLELVTDLTKEAFILSLRRFVSRRGKPSCIYSDNGTNFVSASSELKDLGIFLKENDLDLTDSFIKESIEWKFIPAHSPHFGGLWEAGVKSLKYHLKRVTKEVHLTFEHFYTLLVQIEAILNSRPLSPLSNDPLDLNPLTPSHFLVGRPITSLPEAADLTLVPRNRLSLYQHLEQMKQHFWARWSKEYVSELQERSKWKTNMDSLKEGDLVLIKDDHLPPSAWKLGRVELLHRGNDGVSRVATIRTNRGLVKRAFPKICPLPMDEDNDTAKC